MLYQPQSKKMRAFCALTICLLAAVGVLFKSSCGSYAGNPENNDDEDDNLEMVQLPDVRSIDLTALGRKTAMPLQASEANRCGDDLNLGVFGLPIGTACHTTSLANAIIYGSAPDRDADGAITCADYHINKDDSGILMPLLCEKAILRTPSLKSLRFTEDNKIVAFSFEDFNSSDEVNAIGNWTARGENSGRYPANIRVWTGQPALTRLLALSLKDPKNGKLWLDYNFDNQPGLLTTTFTTPESSPESSPETSSLCSTQPSKTTCYTQEVRLKTFDDPDSIIPGVVLYIYADSRENPGFITIEGKFTYPAVYAEKVFSEANGSPATFKNIREIYIRSIQKGQQIWGTFDFKDEAGKTIATPVATSDGIVDVTAVLRNGLSNTPYSGVCQNRGVDAWVACSDIVYTDYDSLWLGDEAIEPVLPTFNIEVDFTEPPGEDGVVQAL